MGAQGTDVLLSPQARAYFPYAVECKNQEAIGPLYAFWEQALENTDNLHPLLVVKRARSKPLVVLDAERFFEVLARY